MGLVNHGSQDITINYYEEATAFNVNKRNVDMVPRGIYSGGYFAKVTDTEVQLSPFAVEIGDDDIQITSKSTAVATLNSTTLDSGDIDPSTPYLVFRWGYLAQQNNYVEVHAIASVSAAQDNDIIIGKCVFSGATLTGFDYANRTFLNVQNLFLKVEENTGLYVWIRAGRIHTTTGYILIPEQRVGPFSAPSSPNSRIDLVYVNATTGVVTIQQGTPAVTPVAPSYSRKIVVAEVLVVNGDTSIPANQITDVRSFITNSPFTGVDNNSITSTQLKTYDSGWFAVSQGTLYTKAHGLGTLPFIVQVLFSDTADGSGDVIVVTNTTFDYAPSVWAYAGIHVVDMDIANIQLRSSGGVVACYADKTGASKSPTTGYARIRAIA
jgi:hypothetical protein